MATSRAPRGPAEALPANARSGQTIVTSSESAESACSVIMRAWARELQRAALAAPVPGHVLRFTLALELLRQEWEKSNCKMLPFDCRSCVCQHVSCMFLHASSFFDSDLQEAVEDMKQVACVTPRKKTKKSARVPETPRQCKRPGGLRRRLFHSPNKRRSSRCDEVPKERAVPLADSESEDHDIFKDKYKPRKREKRAPSVEISEEKSPGEDGEGEEEEEPEDEEESPTKAADLEPLQEHPSGPGPDGEGGLTLDQKVSMIDHDLTVLLTDTCTKLLGHAMKAVHMPM